eukprot:sb/3478125/
MTACSIFDKPTSVKRQSLCHKESKTKLERPNDRLDLQDFMTQPILKVRSGFTRLSCRLGTRGWHEDRQGNPKILGFGICYRPLVAVWRGSAKEGIVAHSNLGV